MSHISGVHGSPPSFLPSAAFFFQYFRVYSPVTYFKKTDPTGEYVRKYVPVLKKMPKEYIYEPWKAPRSVQENAGCVIGVDYPAPMVQLDAAKAENMARMKRAFEVHNERLASSGGEKRKSAATSAADAASKRAKPTA